LHAVRLEELIDSSDDLLGFALLVYFKFKLVPMIRWLRLRLRLRSLGSLDLGLKVCDLGLKVRNVLL